MEKEMTILGKFYLKNGNVIEEKVTFNKDQKHVVDTEISNMESAIKKGFRENLNFDISFGNFIFRGSEIAAVTITEQ